KLLHSQHLLLIQDRFQLFLSLAAAFLKGAPHFLPKLFSFLLGLRLSHATEQVTGSTATARLLGEFFDLLDLFLRQPQLCLNILVAHESERAVRAGPASALFDLREPSCRNEARRQRNQQ